MTATLLQIHVPGTPKPKGSLRHVGHGRMVEQLAGSPDWRASVVAAAHAAWGGGAPHLGAVRVAIVLELPKPARPKDLRYPSGGNTGDVDKHARNVLDALQDAGVVRNDSQVVDLAVAKRWTLLAPGAHITVSPAGLPSPMSGQPILIGDQQQ
ncbi:RusA family crossover junction endodeoxyribonuclease [Rhizomonospora bruguierae]|uniref:RusA family crossover junction endodeoxyribonuclease n=1 Tax=Rhizomonospora bruguierae TaxID=1581705 RepID=UPI001BCF9E22|nr:RusA family crossover junction endodeoxyribonuclease [Micromonospora sp. NBRC 107566]